MLKKQIKTCEIWSVCDLGINTCHHAIICKQCIFMATLESIEKKLVVKLEGGKDFPIFNMKIFYKCKIMFVDYNRIKCSSLHAMFGTSWN